MLLIHNLDTVIHMNTALLSGAVLPRRVGVAAGGTGNQLVGRGCLP